MLELAYNEVMKFRDWLWDKYLEYSKPVGRTRAKSQAEYARYLGISPVNLGRYLNGDSSPEYSVVVKLAEKLGNGVYDAAGFNQPRQVSFLEFLDNMPRDRITAFFASVCEINSLTSEKGIDTDSPEGFEIIKAVFRKYGL